MLLLLLFSSCTLTSKSGRDEAGRGPTPRILDHYKSEFYRAVGDTVKGKVSLQVLLQTLSMSNLLLLGDFHTDRGYHHRALKLLDRVADRYGPLLLIIEFLRWEDRSDLKEYLDGHISLGLLRNRVQNRNPQSWLKQGSFDPEGFLAFLERAKERSWQVCPVENIRQPPLYLRDRIIAGRARALIQEHHGYFPVVFYGQAHLLGNNRLEGLIGRTAVTILPRPPRSLQDCTAVNEGGLQRIRDRIFFLGPASALELPSPPRARIPAVPPTENSLQCAP